jgi:hypothetical protein
MQSPIAARDAPREICAPSNEVRCGGSMAAISARHETAMKTAIAARSRTTKTRTTRRAMAVGKT